MAVAGKTARLAGMANDPRLKIKVQLLCGNEFAIGPGKAALLEAIAAHGSISAAGRALGMSYRRTWLLADSLNRTWRERLIDTAHGGARGGGARLTALGVAVLDNYRVLEVAVTEAARISGMRLLDDLAAVPRPSQSD